MRLPARVLLLSLATAFLSGCPRESPPADPAAARPFVGRTVRVLAPAPLEAAERWRLILSEFENEWGARAEIVEYDPRAEAPWSHADTSTSRGRTAGETATILIFPLPELADVHARRPLAAIPRGEREGTAGAGGLDWSEVFAGLRQNVCSLAGEPAVVPMSAPVLVCYFRRDLLEQAGLAPPATWSDYQKLLDTLDEWAPGLAAVEPWGSEYRATMFLARAVGAARHPGQYSLFFDVDSGEPLIDGPGFVRGLEQSLAAVARMPAETQTYSPAECRREILAGRAALAVAVETGPAARLPIGPEGWSDAAAASAGDGAPARAESIVLGVSPLPGASEVYNRSTAAWERPRESGVNRVPLTGFGGLAAGVLRDSAPESQPAAWKLLARLAVDEFDTAFRREFTSPCRTSQAAAPSRWVGADLAGDEALAWMSAVSESLRSPLLVAELPAVGRARFRQALTEALGQALGGTHSPAEALTAAADRWRQIADELGRPAVRDSYRASLGLRPARR